MSFGGLVDHYLTKADIKNQKNVLNTLRNIKELAMTKLSWSPCSLELNSKVYDINRHFVQGFYVTYTSQFLRFTLSVLVCD